MKIEYKILWLDDSIHEFIGDEIIEELEMFIHKKGLRANIVTTSKSEEFFEKLDNSYDLILTDYHMNQMNGDKVVEKIRNELSILTEILFYTAQADLVDARKIDRISFLETKSAGGRHTEVVLEKVKRLVELTVKKFDDIVAMRGMIMHETSALDALCLEIVKGYWTKTKNKKLALSIFMKIISFFKEKLKKVKGYKKNDQLERVFNSSILFSFSTKATALEKILEINELDNFIPSLKNDVIQVRNKFAHAVLDEDENGNKVFKNRNEDIVFDQQYCKEIRQAIIKHTQNLEKLKTKLLNE